jgi:hypothetical protein
LQIAKKLKDRSDLPLRIGIHSGPVDQVSDVNDRPNIAGAGINTAQRVMDCGDVGHILLSKRIASDSSNTPNGAKICMILSPVEVKHGLKVHVVTVITSHSQNGWFILARRIITAAFAQTGRSSSMEPPLSSVVTTFSDRIRPNHLAERTTPVFLYDSTGRFVYLSLTAKL